MRVLLVTPPMTQLNTPYPATAYLKGFLRRFRPDIEVLQADPALELVLRLFSRQGLMRIREEIQLAPAQSESVRHFLSQFDRYCAVVDSVVAFLQGKDPSLAMRMESLLPQGPAFRALAQYQLLSSQDGEESLHWAFGSLGVQDRAKFLASLFLDDLALVVREGIDSRFEFSRYGEKLAASQPVFDPLLQAVESKKPTLVDRVLDEISRELAQRYLPDVVGLTAPFPGNVYGACRMAKVFRQAMPTCKLLLGGGYPNTELRELEDPRVFDYFDFITLDDGERPLLRLLEHIEGKRPLEDLYRTYIRDRSSGMDRVMLISSASAHDIPQKDTGAPDYSGLPLDRYLSILEMLNPMHRIWSDGRWNKLTLAHGCYWKKCNFCDVSLDYISRYDPSPADQLVDRMIEVAQTTGQRGFHFVDEASPPAILRQLSERLIERGEVFSWWGNIRFDPVFTPELAQKLKQAGCIAVSGGLEVASDRLLSLMNKGVTVEQVARVTHALTEAGILVHAYLMYGFPSQTVQETIDALERVRQLFEAGCLQSAYWHRFSVTAHSPIGKDPKRFGIIIKEQSLAPGQKRFARNDLIFEDPSGVDHDWLGEGLRRALYNFMHGLGLDQDVRSWFTPKKGIKLRPAQVPPDLVARAIRGKSSRPGLPSEKSAETRRSSRAAR
ncbi:radical SAM protein [bacterium]|nr:radical SAM protein [bacterium]